MGSSYYGANGMHSGTRSYSQTHPESYFRHAGAAATPSSLPPQNSSSAKTYSPASTPRRSRRHKQRLRTWPTNSHLLSQSPYRSPRHFHESRPRPLPAYVHRPLIRPIPAPTFRFASPIKKLSYDSLRPRFHSATLIPPACFDEKLQPMSGWPQHPQEPSPPGTRHSRRPRHGPRL